MNLLEYTLKLNDRMTSALTKIGAQVDDVSSKGRKMKSDVESVNNVSFSGVFSKLKSLAAIVGFGAAAGKSIKTGMENELRDISFDVLLGGPDKAKAMLSDIANFGSKAYGEAAAAQASKLQLAFDIKPDQVMDNLKMMGDIAMGSTEKFNALNLAYSQMSSTGKLTGGDLIQMINAEFNPLVQMMKTTGKSLVQLKDDMGKGLISSDMVRQAFVDATSEGGKYFNMMNRMADSASGLYNSMLSKMVKKMQSFYEVIEPYWKALLRLGNEFLEAPLATIGRLLDKATNAFPVISTVIIAATTALVAHKLAYVGLAVAQGIISVLKGALVAYELVVFAVRNSTSLWTAAQWLLNVALTANPIGLIIAAIAALIAVIAFVIIKTEGWGKTWDNVMKVAGLSIDLFKAGVELKWLQIKDAFISGFEVIEKGWYKLQSLWNEDSANEGLAKLESQRNKRAQEIAKAQGKVKSLSKAIQAVDVWQVKWNDTSFSDIAKGINNKLGISAPTVPGTSDGTGAGGGLGKNGAGSSVGKETANSISTGGSKTTHITINLGKLVETISISKDGFRESAENMRDMIVDELTRALTMSQQQ